MSMTSNIRMYNIFRKDLNLGDEKALELVQSIEQSAQQGKEELATKSFVKEEILATRQFVKEEIHAVKTEIHQLEVKLTNRITDIYRTIWGAAAAQFLAMICALIAIVRFMQHN